MKKKTFFNLLEKMGTDPTAYWDFYHGLMDEMWFTPRNGETDDYTLADRLFQWNLLARRTTPIWVNGSFRGLQIDFMKIKIEEA